MGAGSPWHWIVVIALGILLFGGRGKISELMGDFAKGIKSFKKGMSDDPVVPTSRPPEDNRTIIEGQSEAVDSNDKK